MSFGARSLEGHGFQVGPLRPDFGEGWADLKCDQCGATWTGPIGEPCSWCEDALKRLQHDQAEMDRARASPVDYDEPRAPQLSYRNLPRDFWAARPVLEHIRQAAHSRVRSADAVLAFTLARSCALIPPAVTLPAIVGSAASLNFIGATIGTSGSGKSTSGSVARELVPIERSDVLADVPLGSGEGLAELYFGWKNEEQSNGKDKLVKRRVRDGLYMYLDEGQALGEMGTRKGATLLPTLRAAWSGETIGNANATTETFRVVKAHTYRLALMVGFQAEHAKGLLDDAAGGTPQRFVFASAVDPAIPNEPPDWPGPLDLFLPPVHPGIQFDVATVVAQEIRRRNLAASRGESEADALDSHRDLVRLKVAALLAWIDHRLDVDEEDWQLSGLVMRSSIAVRSWVLEVARSAANVVEMAGHRRAADREKVIAGELERRALACASRAVANRVRRASLAVGKNDLRRAIAGKHRALVSVDEAIEEAEKLHWIRSCEGTLDEGKWLPGDAAPV